MSLKDKVLKVSSNNVTIAEKQQKLYDTAYSKGYSDMDLKFWKSFTNNGARTVYNNAFAYSSFAGYSLPITVKPKGTSGAYRMFYSYEGSYLPSGIDMTELDVSNGNVNYGVSQLCGYSKLAEFPDLGIPAPADYYQTFSYSRSLHTIEVIRVKKATKFTNTFTECFALANVTFEGEIGQNLSMSACTKLTHESLMNIIGCLYDFVSNGETTTRTLTIGNENLSKLTDEEKAIATQKGWTLA